MPPSRTMSSSPAPSADRLVVPLRSVALNGKDPRAEMDGVVELVIKGEREILPGVSWTENRSGIYQTTQIMTILCGNHTLEIIDLGRFAQESARDVLSWRVDRGVMDLTFEYPLCGSRRSSVGEPSSAQESSSQPVSTHQRLRLTFVSHHGFARACSTLETLGILPPAVRIQQPYTPQLPAAPGRPRSGQASRPVSAQAMAPPPHRSSQPHSERSLSSSPYPAQWHRSSPAPMTPPVGREQQPRARSISQMPPPAGRSSSPMDSQRHGSPLPTRSPYSQTRTAPHAGPYRPAGNMANPASGRPRFDGVPSPYRFTSRRNPAQPLFRVSGSPAEQQGIHKPPRRVVRSVIPLPLQASFEKSLPKSVTSKPGSNTTSPSHEIPVSLTDAGPSNESRMQATSAPPSIGSEAGAADVARARDEAASALQPPQSLLFFSSTSQLWKIYLEKSDAAMKAAEDSDEARSKIVYECGHEFALAFNILCWSTNVGS
ncbi:hypothetical protein MAPG_05649 [Magnaporthiopsis poae ATCC 64411]|uniref:Uncharacterized protein n=1 Tax=Magnaporthiopsis poae (strain ATCC 64411 / 73-15) TaxID=644358 RepID=A0A0C4DZY6_MAGP6|nr:hypothetical protein MAPG_05649 [Magnaporthiopsis poae ATCC 64411]